MWGISNGWCYLHMMVPLLVGIGTFIGTVFIYTMMFLIIITLIQFYIRKRYIESKLHNILAIIVAVMLILVSHLCSIALWAWVFIMCGEFGSFETAFYFSSGNYTTLGYGDIAVSKAWRLLGPLEAINGVIMLGWTTAMIFAVQSNLLRLRLKIKSPLWIVEEGRGETSPDELIIFIQAAAIAFGVVLGLGVYFYKYRLLILV